MNKKYPSALLKGTGASRGGKVFDGTNAVEGHNV